MSIRLIDEIYGALHKGERPPYTNARGSKVVTPYSYKTDNSFFVIYDGDEIKPFEIVDSDFIDVQFKKIMKEHIEYFNNIIMELPSSASESPSTDSE